MNIKNVFIIHSYNADTLQTFAPNIEQLCKNNNIICNIPRFAIRDKANYQKWKEKFDEFRKNHEINKNSIIIAHSLGTLFFPKYIAEKGINVDTYISVSGFMNYKGRKELEKIANEFMPTKEQFETAINFISERYSIYSDNDEMNDIKKLEQYAECLKAKKILVKGAGHFNPKSKITEIKEINEILLEKFKNSL